MAKEFMNCEELLKEYEMLKPKTTLSAQPVSNNARAEFQIRGNEDFKKMEIVKSKLLSYCRSHMDPDQLFDLRQSVN